MSIRWMTYVFGLNLPPAVKIVALSIADNANDDGIAWPGIRTIAQKSSMSERSSQRHVRWLVNKKILSVVSRKVTSGGSNTNEYHFHLNREGVNLTPGDNRDTHPGEKGDTTPVTTVVSESTGKQCPEPHSASLTTSLTVNTTTTKSCCENPIYPTLSQPERTAVEGLLTGIPPENHQSILDELAGAIAHRKIRYGVTPYVRSLVRAVQCGTFSPSLGVSIQAARQANEQQAAILKHATDIGPMDPAVLAAGSKFINRIRHHRRTL